MLDSWAAKLDKLYKNRHSRCRKTVDISHTDGFDNRMAQGAAKGLTAEAEAAVIDAVAELRERLQRYDRRGMFGEINIAIIVADGKFDTRCGDYRRKKIKLSA